MGATLLDCCKTCRRCRGCTVAESRARGILKHFLVEVLGTLCVGGCSFPERSTGSKGILCFGLLPPSSGYLKHFLVGGLEGCREGPDSFGLRIFSNESVGPTT